MNENSTMLYKYPGTKAKIRVRKGEKLRFETFDTKIVSSPDVSKYLDEWHRKPQDAFDPPKKVAHDPPNVFEIDQPKEFAPDPVQPEEEVKIPKEEPEALSVTENEPEENSVTLEEAIAEIDAIKGQGAKKRLIKHAKDFGITLGKGNFYSLKKDYLDQLKAQYGNLD